MRIIFCLFIAAAIAATTGCSISDSSGSLSDSISSPSKSISNSSSGDGSGSSDKETPAPETTEDKASYEKDVSQMTLTYIKSGGEIGAFRAAISNLAKTRGVTDWETDAETTRAIGLGAGNAGLQETAFDAFSKQLFGDDLVQLNELRKGYQQAAIAPMQHAEPSNPTSSTKN